MMDAPLLDYIERSKMADRYPVVPGTKAPEGPSGEAAESVKHRAAFLRGRVLWALETFGPLTSDECAEKIGEHILSVRPRLTELGPGKLNRIADTGFRRRNAVSGKAATVWGLNPRSLHGETAGEDFQQTVAGD